MHVIFKQTIKTITDVSVTNMHFIINLLLIIIILLIGINFKQVQLHYGLKIISNKCRLIV